MTEIIEWPCEIARPVNMSLHLRTFDRTAGVSLTGSEQVVAAPVKRWELTLDIPRDFDIARTRIFETLVMRMEGRKNIADLCVCDPYRYEGGVGAGSEPWADGTFWSDGTGWIGVGDDGMGVEVEQGQVAGGNNLKLNLVAPVMPTMLIGQMFSHNGFLYRVYAATNAGRINFMPNLRRAIPAGSFLQTNPPKFYGRFASADQGVRVREYLKWGGGLSISFVEAFDR